MLGLVYEYFTHELWMAEHERAPWTEAHEDRVARSRARFDECEAIIEEGPHIADQRKVPEQS